MSTTTGSAPHWSATTTDPNSRTVQEQRRRRVSDAQTSPVRDRNRVLAEICRGKRVLNLGCVDQLPEGAEIAPLHRQLAAIAGSCTGLDINQDGVAALRAEGFDVVHGDATDPELLATITGPFDVVVAGELMEHLLNVGGLMRNARALLSAGGRMLITVPNPDAVASAVPGMLGWYAGNVDHVADFRPYEMIEIADRTGFELTSWCGELGRARGKRAALHLVGRMARWVRPQATADCFSLIYVLAKRS